MSEGPIVEALKELGQRVWKLNWTMDLLCLDRTTNRFWLADCKTGSGKPTTSQALFLASAGRAPAYIIRTPEEAAAAVNDVRTRDVPHGTLGEKRYG